MSTSPAATAKFTNQATWRLQQMARAYAERENCGITRVGRDAGLGPSLVSRFMKNESLAKRSVEQLEIFLRKNGITDPDESEMPEGAALLEAISGDS